jgi:hypothetical protein
LPVEQFSANGKQCLNWLSHSRGQAQAQMGYQNPPNFHIPVISKG